MPTNHSLIRWFALGTVVLSAHFAHRTVLWVEEAYPLAAAQQMLHGMQLYRYFSFDKPPLTALLPLLWGAYPGVAARVVGALYTMLCSALAYRLSLTWEGEPNQLRGWISTLIMVIGSIFYIPAAAMALAPDLAMVAPHLAAVYFSRRQLPVAAAIMIAICLWTNSKGVLVALACAAWLPSGALAGLALGALQLLLPGNWQWVWQWGARYSADSFLLHPLQQGLLRSANWAGFHATAVVGTGWFFFSKPLPSRWRAAWWLALSAAGVAAGGRFFPRYYFQLLPVVAVLGGVGLARLWAWRPRLAQAALALLLIPTLRFGPRTLDLLLHGDAGWADTALNRDSRAVASRILRAAQATDTILVWGYRPDILAYTRLKLGAPYLDSQPLTGVLADRHLTSSRPTFPYEAALHRRLLAGLHPDWLVDGLGPMNGALAITNYPDLRAWMLQYDEFARTTHAVIYRRRH
jgi:hypothetical protein